MGSKTDNRRDVRQQELDLCRLSDQDALGDESTMVLGSRPVCIGRAPHCDLILRDESVSREHAKIVRTNAGWVINDLGSKNGLKINTYRTRQQQLRDGDCIDIGTAKLWVEIGPLNPTGKARVVFQQELAGHPTEVLDMDRFDSLFASSPDLGIPVSPEAPHTDARSPKPRESSVSLDAPVSLEEPVGLLGVFSQAAEALLTCDGLDQTLERILKLVFENVTASAKAPARRAAGQVRRGRAVT